MNAPFHMRPLVEVADVRAGTPAPQSPEYFASDGFPFVRVQDVGRHFRTMALMETKDRISQLAVDTLRPAFAKKGTIVFPKSGAAIATNSRAILGMDAYVVGHLAMVNAVEELISAEWLYFYLCLIDMGQFSRTAAMPSLRLADLRGLPIPCPALTEQHRIVGRLKECLDRVEEIERLRSGSLVEANAALPSVLNETFVGLSSEYLTSTIGELALETRYGTSRKCHNAANGTAILRIPNVARGFVNFDDLKFCDLDAKELGGVLLRDGDLLFVRTNGSRDLVGRCAIFENAREGAKFGFASYLIRVRANPLRAMPKYLAFFLNSTQGRAELDKRRRTSAGQFNINSENLRSIELPLPPVEKQREVIVSLKEREAQILRLQSHLSESQAEDSHMRESILRKAFVGEL